QKGFSLAECMVSVAILTIILGAVLAYLFMTLNTYKQEAENNNVNLDGRTMLAVMTNELRTAYHIGFDDFQGYDSNGNKKHGKITYCKEYKEGKFRDKREISATELPWQGGNYKDITLSFIEKDNSDIIEIELTLDKSKFTTSVFLSNKNVQGTEESEGSNE
ncbi:MAG: PilW family protein, partial [bacterium]